MKGTREILRPALAEEYAGEGVIHLPGAISPDAVEAMTAAIWRKLEARPGHGARPAQLSSRNGEFDAMASPTLRAARDELLGDWEEPARWGLPLVAFHTGEAVWDVPHEHWRLDLGARPGDLRLARPFAVLAASRPGGGGTGYVARSHLLFQRLAERVGRALPTAEARKRIAAGSSGSRRSRPGARAGIEWRVSWKTGTRSTAYASGSARCWAIPAT